jgi:hypothetical protein
LTAGEFSRYAASLGNGVIKLMPNDIVKYDPTESGNIVIHALQQIAEHSEIILSVKAVSNWITGFTCYLSNEAGLYCSKQVDIRKTSKDFNEYIRLFNAGSDSRARATANFCRRVHLMKDSETKQNFMFQVVSCFRRDMGKSIERFSELEGLLVDKFFDNPFGR